ncbi:MAG: hypothetical protein K2Y51_22515 [Gammaproteobacteria bacterium]|nr:hypothetical protein [Gammaproteobacteria bacterium]
MALRRGTSRDDTLLGSAGDDELLGLAGDDRLRGGAGRDLLRGGTGDDWLEGGAGIDRLRGEVGDDTYLVDHAAEIDRALADAGIDTVLASVDYVLGSAQELLRLVGAADLSGTGNPQANQVTGNAGDNRLSGGAGADRLLGLEGRDVLIFDPRDLRVDGGGGIDTLLVTGGGRDYDVDDLAKVRQVEILDLRGSGANRVALDAARVTALAGGAALRVLADADDEVTLQGDWSAGAPRTLDGVVFDRYVSGAARVDIQRGAEVRNPHVIALGALDGNDGFRVEGESSFVLLGVSVADAGDMNGDGLADLVLGSVVESGLGSNRTAYVVFGRDDGFAARFSTASLDGTQGFRIEQSAVDPQHDSHRSVIVAGAGDVDGDGLADVLVSNTNNGELADQAASVTFGSSNTSLAMRDASTQGEDEGLRLAGLRKGRQFAHDVAGGDVNGDGFADVMIGDRNTPGTYDTRGDSVYVVFGRAARGTAEIDANLVDGSDGVLLRGDADVGNWVASGGDFNGDDIQDLLVDGRYVVFGRRAAWPASVDVTALDGADGFAIARGAALDGMFVSGGALDGDFNGDGIDDLLLSFLEPYNTPGGGGAHYVLRFGQREPLDSSLALLADGTAQRFHLGGRGADAYGGWTARFAGDIDGDGYDDLVFGAPGNDFNGNNAGGAYLVYGRAGGAGATVELDSLDAAQGLRLDGVAANDRAGYAVSAAGDVNGDGYDDLLVGASSADVNGNYSGAVYVVFGGDFRGLADRRGDDGDDNLLGTAAAERLVGGRGDDVLNGAGGNDVLKGGAGDDVLVYDSADSLAVEGDSGTDTLRIDGAGVTLDLTLATMRHLAGIEHIALGGSGANSVVLGVDDVLRLPDRFAIFVDAPRSQVLISGDADDSVTLAGVGWSAEAGSVIVAGVSYQSYVHASAAAQVLVQVEVQQPVA